MLWCHHFVVVDIVDGSQIDVDVYDGRGIGI